MAEPLDDQGTPKIFEKNNFFFLKISLKFCKILNILIILLIPDNIHIYFRKSKNKLNFHLNKIQSINTCQQITIIKHSSSLK